MRSCRPASKKSNPPNAEKSNAPCNRAHIRSLSPSPKKPRPSTHHAISTLPHHHLCEHTHGPLKPLCAIFCPLKSLFDDTNLIKNCLAVTSASSLLSVYPRSPHAPRRVLQTTPKPPNRLLRVLPPQERIERGGPLRRHPPTRNPPPLLCLRHLRRRRLNARPDPRPRGQTSHDNHARAHAPPHRRLPHRIRDHADPGAIRRRGYRKYPGPPRRRPTRTQRLTQRVERLPVRDRSRQNHQTLQRARLASK